MVRRISEALVRAHAAGLERLDAQLLLLHVLGTAPEQLGTRRAWLLAHGEDMLAAPEDLRFDALVQRRAGGEPLAYITGHKEFFGLNLRVDRRVLVPRPDTETLVGWALEVLAEPLPEPWTPPLSVLDLGTGSGAIALALKHRRPDLQVDALDASADALEAARANARNLGLQIGFMQSDWLEAVTHHYHCIVSNPPYVAAHDPHLAALAHEPEQALVSGPDGLDAIRHIVDSARARLHPDGWLLLEHGYDQAEAVRTLLATAGYQNMASRRDLGGHERCTGGQWPGALHCA